MPPSLWQTLGMAKRASKDTDDDVAAPLPRENPELVGQGAAERVLLDAWLSGRLPHAWLIAGRPGVGKATLAYRFARFVLREGAGPRDAGLFGATPPHNLPTAAPDPGLRPAPPG